MTSSPGKASRTATRFRVIQFEMPGWGRQPNDLTPRAEHAALKGRIITAIDVDRFHLLGTSLGRAAKPGR